MLKVFKLTFSASCNEIWHGGRETERNTIIQTLEVAEDENSALSQSRQKIEALNPKSIGDGRLPVPSYHTLCHQETKEVDLSKPTFLGLLTDHNLHNGLFRKEIKKEVV